MERNKRYEDGHEDGLNDFLQHLIKRDVLTEKEAGVAKRAMAKGYDSLSEKQRYVFDSMIKENIVEKCERCGTDIPWCEMIEALDNGGHCNYCQHMLEKMKDE